MLDEDKGEFTKLLAASMDIYGRPITTSFANIFFAALGQYDLATVQEALNRHIQDPDGGRFPPKPADLIRQITNAVASDGRPDKNEAWALAQSAMDESKTVVLTEEILGALDIAKPLLLQRDKVAARMAFLEAYDRIVAERRAQGVPFKWHVSLGEDKDQRIPAIENAQVRGLLPASTAVAMIADLRETPISADGLAVVGLLGCEKKPGEQLSPEDLRSRWQDLRTKVAGSVRNDRMIRHRQEIEQAERELSAINQKRGEE